MNNSYAQSGMHTPVLLSIAASIEPAFPNAADTLRGIADQIADGAEAARPATLAASEPSRVLGEGSDAQEAREAAYARACGAHSWHATTERRVEEAPAPCAGRAKWREAMNENLAVPVTGDTEDASPAASPTEQATEGGAK